MTTRAGRDPQVPLVERALVLPVLQRLDDVRHALLSNSHALTRPFLRSRDLRVLAQAVFSTTLALLLSVHATGYLLLLGPLLLGAPHLVAEARYLAFQPRHGARLVGVAVLMGLFAAAGLGLYALGPCLLLAILVSKERSGAYDVTLASVAMMSLVCAVAAPWWTRFLLLHAHNLFALVLWAGWRDRPWRVSLGVLGLAALAMTSVLLGCFDDVPLRTPLNDEVFSLTRLTDAVAGQFLGAWRDRLLVVFAFTQSLHYAVWLRLVPEEARERETPRAWSSSWQAFKRDTGTPLALLAMFGVVAVPTLAVVAGAVRVRSLYVTASEFHATLELLLAALVWRRGGFSRRTG